MAIKITRRKFIVLGVVIVVVVGGVLVFIFKDTLFNLNAKKTDTTKPSESVSIFSSPRVTTTSAEASQAAYKQGGSTEQAIAVYDASIKATDESDHSTLAGLYFNKAQLAFNKRLYDQALTAELQAVNLAPSATTYGLLAEIYAHMNNTQDAITAYKKALSYLPVATSKNDPNPDVTTATTAMSGYFQSQITKLGNGKQ